MPDSVPKAYAGVVRMSAQSLPSVLPFIQFPPSEMGFSVFGKVVLYVLAAAGELKRHKAEDTTIRNKKHFLSSHLANTGA
jgi:hypothetical protein